MLRVVLRKLADLYEPAQFELARAESYEEVNQLWHQDVPGVADVAEPDEHFGQNLAIGDFNADGFADMVVDVPRENVGSKANAGIGQVLYGSVVGLTTNKAQVVRVPRWLWRRSGQR